MCMELFKSMAGVDLQHIPYRGTVPALTDVMSGQINAMFSTALVAKPQIEAGKVRALGVSTATSAAARCRTFRRSRKPACPATRRRSGTASWRRPERRPRSSRKSTPRR